MLNYIIRVIIAISFVIIGLIAYYVRHKFEIPENNMMLFSIIVILYGIFRLYRAQQFYKELKS